MDLDLDDLLHEPVSGNVRAVAKFQPKAKPRPRKEKQVKFSLPVIANETPVTKTGILQDTSYSIPSAMDTSFARPSPSNATDPFSKLVEDQELVNSTEAPHSEFPQPDGDKIFSSMEISPRRFMGEDVESTDVVLSEVTKCSMDEDLPTCSAKSGIENADFFTDLENLNDILSENTTVNVTTVKKFPPKVKVNAQPSNKLQLSYSVSTDVENFISCAEAPFLHAPNANELEIGPSAPNLSSVGSSTFKPCSYSVTYTSHEFFESQEPVNIRQTVYDRDFLIDNRSGREEAEAFPGLESVDFTSQTTTAAGDAQFFPSESEYPDEGLTPASPHDDFQDFQDFSITRLSDSAATDPPSLPLVSEKLTNNCVDASGSSAVMPLQADEQDFPKFQGKETIKKRKGRKSTTSEDTVGTVHVENDKGNGASKPSRQRRKLSAVPIIDDRMESGTIENGNQTTNTFNYSLRDEDDHDDVGVDGEYREEASHSMMEPSNTTTSQNGKKVRRRKKSSDGTDTSSKESSKKKFSHSTRRNKRQVSNKALLELLEEDINPQQLMIKDLILLAEAKEQKMKKDAAKNSLTNRSVNAPAQDDPNYEDGTFVSKQGLNLDEDEAMVQPNSPIHNYHSYMEKTPRGRWSKQDTELFYEAIRQFGTNFEMIQQLFPGRTRHQVKLKYKKEERQNPFMLSDALTNRSKSHSHFEVVIEKLRQATAEAEKDYSDRDVESIGVSGEVDAAPETNEDVSMTDWDEGLAKSEGRKEDVNDDIEEAVVSQTHDPVQNTHDIKDDYDYKGSDNESDYDYGYVP